jgi:hypothetical protein
MNGINLLIIKDLFDIQVWDTTGKLQAALRTGLDRPLRLVVRSVVGVDTGAEAHIPALDESPLQKGSPPPPEEGATEAPLEQPPSRESQEGADGPAAPGPDEGGAR